MLYKRGAFIFFYIFKMLFVSLALMRYNFNYITKVWLTSSIVGSALFFTVSLINRTHTAIFNLAEAVPFFFLAFIIATFTSIPAVALLWLVVHLLSKTSLNVITTKLLIALTCIAACLFTFSFMGVGFSKREWIIISCYSIPLIVGVFVYRLK
jgi:hypothetical protein